MGQHKINPYNNIHNKLQNVHTFVGELRISNVQTLYCSITGFNIVRDGTMSCLVVITV